MMLWKIVEAHGGTLPADVVALFANTGKEREETLVFVDRLARELGVKVHWLEFASTPGAWQQMGAAEKDRWREVDFATASRNGEPFDEVITRAKMVPTVQIRVCTANLKIHPMIGFGRRLFGTTDFARVIGLRADEPRRVAKARAPRGDVEQLLPLADAGVTKHDVEAFWRAMPFDLELPMYKGETIGGNCDLCYLKGAQKLLHLIREKPERADWWIAQEKKGMPFRIDRPDYEGLRYIALQPQLFDDLPDEDTMPCECTE